MAANSPRQWRRWMWPQPIRYVHLNLLMTFSLNVDFLASQKHRSYSRIFYPPNSAKLNKSFKILFIKDYGLLTLLKGIVKHSLSSFVVNPALPSIQRVWGVPSSGPESLCNISVKKWYFLNRVECQPQIYNMRRGRSYPRHHAQPHQ